MVTMIFIDPSNEDVIKKIMESSHIVWPDSNIDKGG